MATGAEKVASLLLTLDRAMGAELLKSLPEGDRRAVSKALTSMSDEFMGKEAQSDLLGEFQESLTESAGAAAGAAQICGLLTEAMCDEAETYAERIELQERFQRTRAALESIDPTSLAYILRSEHPQAVAAVLLEVGPERASQVIPRFPDSIQQELVERMVVMETPPEEVMIEVMEAAAEKCHALELTGKGRAPNDKLKTVASILNQFGEEARAQLLMNLEINDPELVQRVKEQLFTFDDLLKLGPREIQKVLSGVDTKVLALALKGATPEASDYLLSNVSSRTVERVNEERETMGAVRLSEVRGAQQEMSMVARDLIQRGDIQWASGGGDELVK